MPTRSCTSTRCAGARASTAPEEHPPGHVRPAVATSRAKLARVRPLGAGPFVLCRRDQPGTGPCGPRLPTAYARAHPIRPGGPPSPPGARVRNAITATWVRFRWGCVRPGGLPAVPASGLRVPGGLTGPGGHGRRRRAAVRSGPGMPEFSILPTVYNMEMPGFGSIYFGNAVQ
jgi:hypothetical protein